jgi:hypothetical protein
MRKLREREKSWLDKPQFMEIVRIYSLGRLKGGNKRGIMRGWLK